MAEFFPNSKDLTLWIEHQVGGESAANNLMDVIKIYHPNVSIDGDENDIMETCKQIFNKDTPTDIKENAAESLYGVLAKHNLTTLKKEANNKMKNKTAGTSPESRQRNNWVRGNRNKWNRVVDGFNEGTPWRVDRDKFYNFTHYYTDAITFDEDPSHVYSGEAIWRSCIMDKFYREYQDKDGRWVGGYINDRFHVFPDAGTPSNPGVDRMGGNQMNLAPGERTRKPRPQQYSIERRLEESRGNKTEDLEVTASNTFGKIMKVASTAPQEEKENDKIYSIITDIVDMREANLDYEARLTKLSSHYDSPITHIAQIEKFVSNMISKHDGIGYSMQKNAFVDPMQVSQSVNVRFDDGVRPINQNEVEKLPGGRVRSLVDGKEGIIVEDDMNTQQNMQQNEQEIHEDANDLGLFDNAVKEETGIKSNQPSIN